MECWFIDLKQLATNKLVMDSQQHPLIAVYVNHEYAIVGELAHRLRIPLSDILFGYASLDNMDIVVLTFSDHNEAKDLFALIPKDWRIEGTLVLAQLWNQGCIEMENL